MRKFASIVDASTALIGRIAAWGIVLAIVVSAGNAIVRKTFDVSSNALLELQWYLFGAAFMFAASWTFARDEHTRIDIIFSRFSIRTRAWIDLFGHIFFLAPFVGLMIWRSVPYVERSILSAERSANAGGLQIWPAKLLILAGFILLAVQLLAQIAKAITVLSDRRSGKPDDEGKAAP